MDTTYIDRGNANKKLFDKANQQLKEEGKETEVTTFIDAYNKQTKQKTLRIIRKEGTPIYNISFQRGRLRKWIHPNRRVGRPRMNWTEETIREIWDIIKKDTTQYKYTAFNPEDTEMTNIIRAHIGLTPLTAA